MKSNSWCSICKLFVNLKCLKPLHALKKKHLRNPKMSESFIGESIWGIYPTKRQQSMATSCHFIFRSLFASFFISNFVLVSFCKHLCCSHIFLVGRAGGLAFLFWICTLYVCVNTHTHTVCTYLSLMYLYIYILYTHLVLCGPNKPFQSSGVHYQQ